MRGTILVLGAVLIALVPLTPAGAGRSPAGPDPNVDGRCCMGDAYFNVSGSVKGVYMFGGRDETGTPEGDLWKWNYTQKKWGKITPNPPTPAPCPRGSTRMVFGSGLPGTPSAVLILFGGAGGTGCSQGELNDVWFFDGTKWTECVCDGQTNRPTGRESAGLSFDSDAKKMVMFGGSPGPQGDTWILDLSNPSGGVANAAWTQCGAFPAPPCGTPPSARNTPSMAFDLNRHKTVMFGGTDANHQPLNEDTYTYDFTNGWASCVGVNGVTPCGVLPAGFAARTRHRIAWNGATSSLELFGGDAAGIWYNDLFQLPANGSWSVVTPVGSRPAGRCCMALVYDPNQIILFMYGGGLSDTQQSVPDAFRWVQSTLKWTCISAALCHGGARE